ncbi:hypothetical protein [Streptomyces sp. NPDC021562]|uniref:hypothetical protein n=1 Tax=Streptomyces sp. NPDC021562 TaxID=3155121 RepID=UPI0033E17B4B
MWTDKLEREMRRSSAGVPGLYRYTDIARGLSHEPGFSGFPFGVIVTALKLYAAREGGALLADDQLFYAPEMPPGTLRAEVRALIAEVNESARGTVEGEVERPSLNDLTELLREREALDTQASITLYRQHLAEVLKRALDPDPSGEQAAAAEDLQLPADDPISRLNSGDLVTGTDLLAAMLAAYDRAAADPPELGVQGARRTGHTEDGGEHGESGPLPTEEAQLVAGAAANTINHTLARLFLRLGPPPESANGDFMPVSSGGGGAQQ